MLTHVINNLRLVKDFRSVAWLLSSIVSQFVSVLSGTKDRCKMCTFLKVKLKELITCLHCGMLGLL